MSSPPIVLLFQSHSLPLRADAESHGTTELPGDVAATHYAHDLATDRFLEHRPPWHQTEAEPVVDHRETAADELSRTEKLTPDRLPLADGLESQAAFGRQVPADPLDLLMRQRADEIGLAAGLGASG
jgi:hypothetical protein